MPAPVVAPVIPPPPDVVPVKPAPSVDLSQVQKQLDALAAAIANIPSGAPGKDGKDGKAGPPGQDGKAGGTGPPGPAGTSPDVTALLQRIAQLESTVAGLQGATRTIIVPVAAPK